ncbi:MAG: hypothetical protein K2P79_12935 [Sphingomonas sp.]|nr:hypothetical protein [Sphingomonas sp.]
MKPGLFLALLSLAAGAPAADRQPQAKRPPPISIDGLPIGAIPRQELPPSGCAAFLWSKTQTSALVAMLTTDPAQIRFAPGGIVTDLVRVAQSGGGGHGFATSTDYAGGDWRLTVAIDVVDKPDLIDGAAIPTGTVTLAREGKDSVVLPVAGVVACT